MIPANDSCTASGAMSDLDRARKSDEITTTCTVDRLDLGDHNVV